MKIICDCGKEAFECVAPLPHEQTSKHTAGIWVHVLRNYDHGPEPILDMTCSACGRVLLIVVQVEQRPT